MKNRLRDSTSGILHLLKVPSNSDSLFSDPDATQERQLIGAVLMSFFAALVIGFFIGRFHGYEDGLRQGQDDDATIGAAAIHGPAAEDAWASILFDNDPVSELADCKKKIFIGGEGQRFCEMSVWLDPSPPPPAAPIPGTASHKGPPSHNRWWLFSW